MPFNRVYGDYKNDKVRSKKNFVRHTLFISEFIRRGFVCRLVGADYGEKYVKNRQIRFYVCFYSIHMLLYLSYIRRCLPRSDCFLHAKETTRQSELLRRFNEKISKNGGNSYRHNRRGFRAFSHRRAFLFKSRIPFDDRFL